LLNSYLIIGRERSPSLNVNPGEWSCTVETAQSTATIGLGIDTRLLRTF